MKIQNGANAGSVRPSMCAGHTFEPQDPIEVETPHGKGIVLYITVYGVHGNDMWCVANKEDGRLCHYETTHLKLAYNGVLELNKPAPANGAKLTGKRSGH